MIKMNIALNDQALYEILARLSPFGKGLPMTERAAKTSASIIRDAWRGYAMGGSLGGIETLKNPNGGYARSIKINQKGKLSYEIVSEAQIAEWLEKGTPKFDMKKTHTKGPRSRVSERGYGYLIVPFRWGTPQTVGFRNVMSINAYNIVKKFEKMRTLVSADNSTKQTPNNQTPSQMVGRAQYNQGYDQLSGIEFEGTIEEKTRMDGMVRAEDSTGKNRASGYFTFRVISADPKANPESWIHPGIRARPVTETVAKTTQETVTNIIDGALRGDLGL